MENVEKIYFDIDKNLRIKRGIVGCILSIFLVPAGISLDYFLYPDFLTYFLRIRLLCSLLTSIILFAHYTNLGKLYIRYLTFVWLLMIQMAICYMIFTTDKYLSTYYAGLNLAILATAIVLPFSMMEMIIFCASTIILYFFAAYDAPLSKANIMFNNIYFLVLTAIISVTATYLNSRNRFRQFLLNHKLQSSMEQLQSTQIQLIQSEKINAIGNLSAGLLHEINNPLNYTMTGLQMIKHDPKITEDADLKEIVGDIEEGMGRIKMIVGDLRAFAYPSEADKQNQFKIFEAVQNALRFTAHEAHGMQIINNVTDNLNVTASKTHIVQILINLITNAIKAIKPTGHAGIITIDAVKENDRVIISVADNGIGMDEQTLKKIFDPFFTTAEVGSGVGLGLSICHTIAKTHGGSLHATSKLGQGSVFYFDLSV